MIAPARWALDGGVAGIGRKPAAAGPVLLGPGASDGSIPLSTSLPHAATRAALRRGAGCSDARARRSGASERPGAGYGAVGCDGRQYGWPAVPDRPHERGV